MCPLWKIPPPPPHISATQHIFFLHIYSACVSACMSVCACRSLATTTSCTWSQWARRMLASMCARPSCPGSAWGRLRSRSLSTVSCSEFTSVLFQAENVNSDVISSKAPHLVLFPAESWITNPYGPPSSVWRTHYDHDVCRAWKSGRHDKSRPKPSSTEAEAFHSCRSQSRQLNSITEWGRCSVEFHHPG